MNFDGRIEYILLKIIVNRKGRKKPLRYEIYDVSCKWIVYRVLIVNALIGHSRIL